jgi:hypothetical protein
MNNLYTPERLPGETFAAYKKRREASRRAANDMTLADIGSQRGVPSAREVRRRPRLGGMGHHAGQRTNPGRNTVRAAKAASSPRQYRTAVKAARRLAKESL